jgi:hypothetical protein
MPTIEISNPIAGAGVNAGGGAIQAFLLGSPAVGATTAVHAAVTDNGVALDVDGIHAAVVDTGSTQTITTGITNPVRPTAVTATAGGTEADIKAIQVTIHGTDADDEVIEEDLPAFTVNAAGTVTGSLLFKTITSIVIPAHDGNGATTSVGWPQILGVTQTVTSDITNPAVCRNVTATAGGTSGDVKAIQVTVTGTNINGEVISETLPAFTVNTTGTVTGSKAFKTVTSISIPAHDGPGATTAIGTGAKLGLYLERSRDTVNRVTFNGVREGTHPTVTFDADEVEKNTVTLNSTLDGSAVIVDQY